ncbi:MAG: alpha-glucuronidase family glycosyl hydrolase [Petrimonas sp.]|nr:alpha-glucuronidase family glycosyl hydrolase [Petrimonas sp.]
MKLKVFILLLTTVFFRLTAEDGSRLWLRFTDAGTETIRFSGLLADNSKVAVTEFQRAWKEMGKAPLSLTGSMKNNLLIIATPHERVIRRLIQSKDLANLSDEGYIIKTINNKNQTYTVVSAKNDAGLLYGVYHLLRLIQTNASLSGLNISENPSYERRLLNHWDNLDRTVERGYAGHSIWQWDELPGKISPRYKEYARANAFIGINGTVLNNVNAAPEILSREYLEKVKVIAGELRPFNVKVYLSVNFASPKELGGLQNSDPLNADVQRWWKQKVSEIYTLIPDFGGFLVKANSEGLPGPMDYGRTHADGANMLADALKSYGGIVMWRAFVYNPDGDDRAKQAYKEFKPLDGKFRDNVIIQLKNGPVDFQPREPFSPLFGAMKQTPIMPEFQITQEYLGFSNHLVFLSPMWKECLDSDTYCAGKGSTVAKTTDGRIFDQKITAIAGVSNIGEDINWTGHHFAQANWYAFGRLAWNNALTSEQIADEWIRMTFTKDQEFVEPVKKMMLTSHQTAVDYMMPLGLHHIFAWGHHYGPEPWCDVPGARPDWLPKYYHNASENGIGFDRTTSGSDAVSQYNSPLREEFNDIKTCPEEFLLWFHHVAWDYRMNNGKTLWNNMCYAYDSGVNKVREYQKVWDRMEDYVDKERFVHIQSRLRIQSRDAVWWKDACLLYFQQFSREPIPYDIERPVYDLEDLMKIKLDLKHHN